MTLIEKKLTNPTLIQNDKNSKFNSIIIMKPSKINL